MKIIAKYEGSIGRKSYAAIKGCNVVLVTVYQNAADVHVIVSATGANQFSFFAPCFSDEKMWQLLQTWIRAYL